MDSIKLIFTFTLVLLIGFSISFSQALGVRRAAVGGGSLDRLDRRGSLGAGAPLVTTGTPIGRET